MAALAALAFEPRPAQAAVTEAWVHRYSNVVSNANDQASKVLTDAAGDLIVTGTTDSAITGQDILTVKYSGLDGSVLWQHLYNGPANLGDIPNSVGVDRKGNVVVVGYSYNAKPCWCYNDQDYYMAKYAAADGALLWERRYRGPGNYSYQDSTVASDGSGDLAVTGVFWDSAGLGFYAARFSGSDGSRLWEKQTRRGGFAVGIDGEGNVVVAGNSAAGNDSSDYYTAKYAAADGALLWDHRYNGPANRHDTALMLAIDASGNIVVTGISRNESNIDYYTAKYAARDGALLWEQRYNSPANHDDVPTALAVDGSGNVVVTGNSAGDYYTARYAAADGALLWEKRGLAGTPASVGADRSGDVVVTGSSGNGPGSDYYTAKYAAANGALLWEKRYNGPADGDDLPSGLAIGADGTIAITGSSEGKLGSDSAYDYATVVYRESPSFVSIALVSTVVRLRFTCIPAYRYNIERAPAVTGPWNSISTQTAPASGLLEYFDTLPQPGSGFYRTVKL